MILMPQIFDVTANENARYKRNELEFVFVSTYPYKISVLFHTFFFTFVNVTDSQSF